MSIFTEIFWKLVFVCYVTSYWNVSSAIPLYPEEGNYFEGDLLEPLPTIDPKSGLIDVRYRWPNNELIYEFDAGFVEASRTRFMSGLNHIVGRTCMRFKTRTTETDYVRVFQGSGCYSYVGRIGGRQDLSLGNGCVFMGTIVHEVIHAIGFYHEQSRSDRDNYVIINWENIAEGQQHNFDKFEDTMVSPFNVPYDYSSVMHYSRTAFSKNGLDTITVKSGAEIGHRSAMSNLDWTKVNNMYCPNTLGIRIINAGDNLYLQGAGPSSEGVAVIASSFQKEDHQLWTVHYGRLHTQTGSTIVPWSQDGGPVKYMVENSSSNVLIASNTTQSREMWMVRPVNPPAPNPHQIVNVASGLCLYSRGSLQARTGNCNVNDISQIWNIYQA